MHLQLCLLMLSVVASNGQNEIPCIPRDYGNGGTVCVCNKDHCDTVPPVEKVDVGKYVLYSSSKSGLRFKKTVGSFEKSIKAHESVVTIDFSTTYQVINGWGGAFTDATGININSLPVEAKQHLLRSYFSSDGIEYSLCRVPIGGTDFSTHGYSYDDGEVDTNLNNFKLAPEDYSLKLPLIKEAKVLGQSRLKLFASVWTAPKWMKTNSDYSGIGFIKKNMYQVWANYFLKFFDHYKEEGIEFWGVTTQNEPSLAMVPFVKINSVAWTYHQMSDWISNHLGPTLRNSSYSDIKIMCVDDQRFFLPWFVDKLFQHNVTKNYVDGIAYHWYFNRFVPASLLSSTHDKYPNKFILSTEACKGDKFYEDKVLLGSWSRGEEYAEDIIENTQHWVTGWIDWNMALDTTGGPTYINNFVDSPILVNKTSGEFYKQPMYYAIGHFSKFVPPGSKRIFSKSNQDALQIAGFLREDNGIALVVLNKHDRDISLQIKDQRNGTIAFVASKRSMNTIIYWWAL